MKITIIDYKTKEKITDFIVRKNLKHVTIIDKVKEKLKQFYNYDKNITMLPTGTINYATGENDIHYACFGIKKILQ